MKKENTVIEKSDYNEFEVYKPKPVVGCYRVGKPIIHCTKFFMYHKPKRVHRFFMRVFLGWYWEDNLN